MKTKEESIKVTRMKLFRYLETYLKLELFCSKKQHNQPRNYHEWLRWVTQKLFLHFIIKVCFFIFFLFDRHCIEFEEFMKINFCVTIWITLLDPPFQDVICSVSTKGLKTLEIKKGSVKIIKFIAIWHHFEKTDHLAHGFNDPGRFLGSIWDS